MNSIYVYRKCSVTHVNHNPEQTWNARSTNTPTMNAVFKLENPDVQNAAGAFPLPYPAAADAVHSWPPFAHSHSIFSFLSHVKQLTALSPESNEALYPLSSSTIMIMSRMAEMTIRNGHRTTLARDQTEDRCDRDEIAISTSQTRKWMKR